VTDNNVGREVADFMIAISEDAKKRESFLKDRQAFLQASNMSDTAKDALASVDHHGVLSAAFAEVQPPAAAFFVIVLETVTTDVFVV